MGQNGNGVKRVGHTMVRQTRQPPGPWTRQATATLPVHNWPTDINTLHYAAIRRPKTRLTAADASETAIRTTSGYATTGSSTTEATLTKPTMRWPRPPHTNHIAAAAAT